MKVASVRVFKKQQEFILCVSSDEVSRLKNAEEKSRLFNLLVPNNRGGQVCKEVRKGLKTDRLYIKAKVFC